MYVHVCIGSTDESLHSLSMWQHEVVACIKHSHEMEEEHNATTWQWQNGRIYMKDMHKGCASSTAGNGIEEGTALMKGVRLT